MSHNPYHPPQPSGSQPVAPVSNFRPATPMQRYMAALTDAAVILIVIFVVSRIMSTTGIDSSYVGFLVLMAAVLAYEPFMVSRFSGTLGHKFFRLSVVMEDEKSRLGLFRALVRYLLKGLLGLISLLWMLGSRRQALHDRLTKSKVIRR